MSEAENSPEAIQGEIVVVARAVKTRGLKGELVAELLTDFPDRFGELENLIAVAPDGQRTLLELEDHWFQNDRIVLKFGGYNSIEEAQALVGYDFAVREEDRVELPEDHFFEWELTGCRVETVEGAHLGSVNGLIRTGGVEILEIKSEDGESEYMVPLAEEICVEIDIERKLIKINPPEGLLEF